MAENESILLIHIVTWIYLDAKANKPINLSELTDIVGSYFLQLLHKSK